MNWFNFLFLGAITLSLLFNGPVRVNPNPRSWWWWQ
jgi:hypothetical protein